MKFIITGGLGHIGSQLIRELPGLDNKVEIVVIDNLSTQRYCSLFNLPRDVQYSFIEEDVKKLQWKNLLSGADAVIHLAATTDAAGTVDKPDLVYQNNFESTALIASACLDENVPFVFPSSTSVYGSQSERVDEDCIELQPQSPYADCKIKEEAFLRELFEKGLKGAICRLGTVHGISPGMRFHTAVNKFCWQAAMGQPISVWETAIHQKRPYLALDDAVGALSWIISKKLYGGEVYNIVTGNHTVNDILEIIKKHISPIDVQLVHHKIMNQLSYEVSAQKFLQTGYVFKGSLVQDIGVTIQMLQNANNQA
jgi:nucleoside-diphosphate-sugar epimerase